MDTFSFWFKNGISKFDEYDVKIFTIKSIRYFILGIGLLYSQIIYAESPPAYFIGLQANQSEQTPQATPFVYICAPIDATVPPSYICTPTSVPTVAINQSAQPQAVYPQTLKASDIYNSKPYVQQHPLQYQHFGASTSLSNYHSPQYRPYEIDFKENYNDSPFSSHQNVSTEPSLDSWSPTSNFATSHSQVLNQNNQNKLFSLVYPQNPYINNIKNNVWQTTPHYRHDKNMPSNIPSASSNPFMSQPTYQSEIKR